MGNLIQKTREKRKEKEYEKPKYPIIELYLSAIVKLTKREYELFGISNNFYKKCKDFAVFKKVGSDKFVHIKSGQILKTIDSAVVGDYCVLNPVSFMETYPIQIREAGYTRKTKLSKKYIEGLETAQNMEWAHGPIPMHNLFGA